MPRFDLEIEASNLNKIIRKVYSGRLKVAKIVKGAHDANWTKEYELFYAKQPKSKPFVKRLILRDGKTPYGFVHLRPVSDLFEVTESYLSPPKEMKDSNRYFIKCLRTFEEYGESVECVPFIMPETIFGMCAHGSVWICLKILENKYKGKINAYNIPYIQNLATGKPFADREGLFFVQIARLLRMCNCNSFYTNNEDGTSDGEILFSLYSYIESGLPVIVGVDVKDLGWSRSSEHGYHSVVVIGHTMQREGVDGFIIHDECAYPYQVLTIPQFLRTFHCIPRRQHIREFVVAVPSEVGLKCEIAYHELIVFRQKLENLGTINWTQRRIRHSRPMLVSKEELTQSVLSGRALENYKDVWILLAEAIYRVPLSEYYWVYFFYQTTDDRLKQKDVGFFLRDATLKSDFRLLWLKDEKKAVYQKNSRIYCMEFDERKRPRQRKIQTL